MSATATDSRICLALLVLVMLGGVASGVCSAEMSGTWGSASYRVELTVTGATVSGTFTPLLDRDGTPGTISGRLQDGGKVFQAEWTRPMGAGHGGFNTLLALDSEGRVLVGYRWNEGFDPSSFSLHRAVGGEIPQLVDVDEFDGPPVADAPAAPDVPPAPVIPTRETPTPLTGQVVICRSVEDGRPVGAGTAFEQLPEITLLHRYQDATAGAAEAAWFRDGDEIVRSVTHVQAGNGWVSFRLLSGDAPLLPAGRYEVELVMPGRTPVRTAFTMGQTTAGGQTGPTIPAPTPAGGVDAGERGDFGGVSVGSGLEAGRTTGTTDHFDHTNTVIAVIDYENIPRGSTAVAIWTCDGEEFARGEKDVGGNGSASFGIRTRGGVDMEPGRYTVTITVGETVLGRKSFTIGTRREEIDPPQPTPAPAPVPALPALPDLPSPIDALLGEWRVVMAMLDGPQPTTLSVRRDGDGVVGTLDDRINAWLRLRAAGQGNNYTGTWTDPQAGTVAVTASITPHGALIVKLVEGIGGNDLLFNALPPRGGTGTAPATPAPTTTPAVVSVPNLSGDWKINANNSRSVLTLQHEGNRLTGTVFGVPIENGRVLDDGTVTFIRTRVNQTYTGTFSVEPDGTWKLSGTFDCPVTRTTGSLWVATRDPRGGEAPPPTLPPR
ncbi:MAG: hypothetical protein ACOX9R_04335 [Armatimonadota bacterium]|jgi:hypothetical protein